MQVLTKANELHNDTWQFCNAVEAEHKIEEKQLLPFSQLDDAQLTALDFSSNALWIKLPEELAKVKDYLPKMSFIGVYFPVFKNGVGFSIARRLRDEFGFQGEIRAYGHLIPDQFPMLIECGFDSVALNQEHDDVNIWQHSYTETHFRYQQDSKGDFLSVLKQRHNTPV